MILFFYFIVFGLEIDPQVVEISQELQSKSVASGLAGLLQSACDSCQFAATDSCAFLAEFLSINIEQNQQADRLLTNETITLACIAHGENKTLLSALEYNWTFFPTDRTEYSGRREIKLQSCSLRDPFPINIACVDYRHRTSNLHRSEPSGQRVVIRRTHAANMGKYRCSVSPYHDRNDPDEPTIYKSVTLKRMSADVVVVSAVCVCLCLRTCMCASVCA